MLCDQLSKQIDEVSSSFNIRTNFCHIFHFCIIWIIDSEEINSLVISLLLYRPVVEFMIFFQLCFIDTRLEQ